MEEEKFKNMREINKGIFILDNLYIKKIVLVICVYMQYLFI